MNYSQPITFDYEDVSVFVTSLYEDGNKPCEQFGMSWDEMSEMEDSIPEYTTHICEDAECA